LFIFSLFNSAQEGIVRINCQKAKDLCTGHSHPPPYRKGLFGGEEGIQAVEQAEKVFGSIVLQNNLIRYLRRFKEIIRDTGCLVAVKESIQGDSFISPAASSIVWRIKAKRKAYV